MQHSPILLVDVFYVYLGIVLCFYVFDIGTQSKMYRNILLPKKTIIILPGFQIEQKLMIPRYSEDSGKYTFLKTLYLISTLMNHL